MKRYEIATDSAVYESKRCAAFIRWARIFGRPARSKGAERLWRWSNQTQHVDLAMTVMRRAGYIPFMGFPLVRSAEVSK